MTVENIDVKATIEKVRKFLKEEKDISAAFKSTIELLLMVVVLLVNRLNVTAVTAVNRRQRIRIGFGRKRQKGKRNQADKRGITERH